MAWGLPKKAAPPENEASANKDIEEKKSAVDSSTEASNDNQTAKKTDPREKFLSKLEQQSNTSENSTTADMKSNMKDTSDNNIVFDTEDNMKQASKEKDTTLKAAIEKKDEAAPLCSLKTCCNTQKVELPIGDQLLINYLSKYCEEPVTGGGSNATAAISSPSDWLHDIEPSSLSFLKGLAGIKEPPSLPTTTANNDTVVAFNFQDTSVVPSPTIATAVTDQKLDTSIPSFGVTNSKETIKKAPKDEFGNTKTYKIYEVIVPSHVTPGQPFVLKASGVTVRVKCPPNVKTGQKIRFHLPTKLFDVPLPPPPLPPPPMPSQQILEEDFSDMMALEEAMFAGVNKATLPPVKMIGIGAPKDDEMKPKSKPSTNNNTTNNNNNNGDETSVQNRMLDIIERQQTQLADMQARIDVLGGMMAQLQNDVGYLCHNTWQQQQNNDDGHQGRQQQQQQNQQRMMGGLFGRGDAPPGIAQQLPQAVPAVAHRGQRAPPLHQQLPAVPPQQGVPVVAADAAAPRHHQGFFFPLFAALFRFIIDLPQRVRTLLLSTGVGRVYTHLRQEAIARDAFRNIDFGSLIKLVVMLLIFTGRVGGDSGGGRNNRRNQNQEADGGIFYILLQSMIDYWNGHRVHALVIASMIAFLIQVGLMSFFYQVLWVERGELLRVWLGQDPPADVEETEDSANDGDDDADQQGDGGGEAREDGANNNNNNANPPAQRPRPRQRARDWRRHPNHVPPARRNVAQPAPAEEGIYLFRRGENGGFFHDIQSLFLSFLLSLIPAWRVEEAAEPLPAPEPEPGQPSEAETDQAAAPQQPEAADGQDGQEGENSAGDDNEEDDGNAAE